MPYEDVQQRICGFLDIEENENSNRFHRRYFILDTQGNLLLWYMDNPQNLPSGADAVGSLRLPYISKVSEATAKQKPKTEFCFVINALSRRYFLQANDLVDMKEWVIALNNATKITVPKLSHLPNASEITEVTSDAQGRKQQQQAYKTEVIGGVVVHTPIQNEGEDKEIGLLNHHGGSRRLPSTCHLDVLRCGYCVKQGNVRKSWKRRFFRLDGSAVSYYKSETDKEPLRSILLKDIQKVHECLVKSGDLLMRDNLFEIITASRVFYIQSDTPEDMQGWIKAIAAKIQVFRGPVKGTSHFTRSSSLYRYGNQQAPPKPRGDEERKAPLVKSSSVVSSWQPWTPVPDRAALCKVEEAETHFSSLPALSSCPAGRSAPRRRHQSHPQPPSSKSFPFSIDEDGVRTTDV